ncbi:MAG: hypothetical protein AAGA66_02385 [Bacteroidota bacterium]
MKYKGWNNGPINLFNIRYPYFLVPTLNQEIPEDQTGKKKEKD